VRRGGITKAGNLYARRALIEGASRRPRQAEVGSACSLQSRGELKTIPSAPGNRSCAGLRGGAGRTRTSNQTIMDGG
jgi:hypothetical protein